MAVSSSSPSKEKARRDAEQAARMKKEGPGKWPTCFTRKTPTSNPAGIMARQMGTVATGNVQVARPAFPPVDWAPVWPKLPAKRPPLPKELAYPDDYGVTMVGQEKVSHQAKRIKVKADSDPRLVKMFLTAAENNHKASWSFVG